MFIGKIHTAAGDEQCIRARSLGQAIDFAMDTSTRRAGVPISIYAVGEHGLPTKVLLTVTCAGRGLAIVSHISEMPEREPDIAKVAAEVAADEVA